MKTLSLALLALVSLTLLACGSEPDAATPAPTEATAANASPTAEATETATEEPTPSGPLSVAQWAAQMCGAAQAFEDEMTALDDGIDPSTLELDARKERSGEQGAAQEAALLRMRDALAAISPPEEAEDFHDALVAQADGVAVAVRAATEQVAEATSNADIEAANADLGIAQQKYGAPVNDLGAALPAPILAAVNGVSHCGLVTQ